MWLWDDGVLAFISDCGTQSQIYMIDVSRHILVQIGDNAQTRLPKWDGEQLDLVEGRTFPVVYYGASADVVNADTSGFFLPSSANEVSNIWGQAPDGRWAIVMFRDDNYEIYITNGDNQHAYRLTYNQCDDHYPRWQP
jgi:hypothetical protein